MQQYLSEHPLVWIIPLLVSFLWGRKVLSRRRAAREEARRDRQELIRYMLECFPEESDNFEYMNDAHIETFCKLFRLFEEMDDCLHRMFSNKSFRDWCRSRLTSDTRRHVVRSGDCPQKEREESSNCRGRVRCNICLLPVHTWRRSATLASAVRRNRRQAGGGKAPSMLDGIYAEETKALSQQKGLTEECVFTCRISCFRVGLGLAV